MEQAAVITSKPERRPDRRTGGPGRTSEEKGWGLASAWQSSEDAAVGRPWPALVLTEDGGTARCLGLSRRRMGPCFASGTEPGQARLSSLRLASSAWDPGPPGLGWAAPSRDPTFPAARGQAAAASLTDRERTVPARDRVFCTKRQSLQGVHDKSRGSWSHV